MKKRDYVEQNKRGIMEGKAFDPMVKGKKGILR